MTKLTWAGVAILAIGAGLLIVGALTGNESLSSYGAQTMAAGGLTLGIDYTNKKKSGESQ